MLENIIHIEKPPQVQEKTLQVIDNAVGDDLAERIWQIVNRPKWHWGHMSRKSAPQKFWAMDLNGEEAMKELFESVRPHFDIAAHTKLALRKVNASGHTHGLGGAIHQDYNTDDYYSMLYYANPVWHPKFGGETQFYSDDLNYIIHSVMPKPSRVVFFDGRIPHFGRSPSREFWGVRVAIAFKLKVITRDAAAP
ncbi:2OG-Fe(II) oxygenase [Exilibacterium tricleocarpae]|nr:2OG-Fe(II) oxygenase [Exilibacterium tricleocarpae]